MKNNDLQKDIEALCVIAVFEMMNRDVVSLASSEEVADLVSARWNAQPNNKTMQELADSFIEYLKATKS